MPAESQLLSSRIFITSINVFVSCLVSFYHRFYLFPSLIFKNPFPHQALREAHEQFKASLSAAKADFKSLESLDAQIKSFKVGPNPYTWFTMEALEETWNNLQKIIRVS